MNYKQYLKSEHWKNIRNRFIKSKRYNWLCFICNKELKNPVIHHKTYKNIWKEKLHNLVAVCKWCHKDIHFENWVKLPLIAETLNNRVYFLKQKYKPY